MFTSQEWGTTGINQNNNLNLKSPMKLNTGDETKIERFTHGCLFSSVTSVFNCLMLWQRLDIRQLLLKS